MASEGTPDDPARADVPAWQRRDPVAIDPDAYRAWCDEKLAALMAEPIGAGGAGGAVLRPGGRPPGVPTTATVPGASGPDAAAAPPLHQFGSREHQALGEVGSGDARYVRHGLALTHGDLVMLRGDYFDEATLLARWARPSSQPGRQPGTQDEVLCAIHGATSGADPRFAPGGPWADLTFSDEVKAAVRERYYRLAAGNRDHFVDPDGTGARGDRPARGSAPGSYRDAHERAIAAAYQAGAAGRSIDDAMIVEAMGQHFLTDAFAAGHVTTPRQAIVEHWRRRYPDFGTQFVDKLVRDVAHRLDADASLLSAAIPAGVFASGVRAKVTEALAGKPLPTLGDLLGSIAHDHDNHGGVRVVNDLGWRWTAYGDSHLGVSPDDPREGTSERSHQDVVVAAVAAGCDDVRTAFSLGQAHARSPLDLAQVYDQVRQMSSAPATPGDRYAPEQLMPRVDPDAGAGRLAWQADDLAALWRLPIRPGGPTYGALIVEDARGGTVGEELEAIAGGLDERLDPFAEAGGVSGAALDVIGALAPGTGLLHGHVYPRAAFEHAVLRRLRDDRDALAFLLELVSGR